MAGKPANSLADAVVAVLGSESAAPAASAGLPRPKRIELWDMDQALACPVIGTCLTINDLVQALRKAGVEWDERPSDFEVHHLVVHRMDRPSRLARIIAKTLDKRYNRFVRGIGQEQERKVLEQAWDHAVVAGEVPGTLWALVTNPASGESLLQRLYQDVHMLSHLNGGSHRKELGRLHALERENGGLSERLHTNGGRYREKLSQKDRCIRDLEQELAALRNRPSNTPDTRGLELQLSDARRELARAELRAERAETRLGQREQRHDELSMEVSALRDLLQETREELALTERRLMGLLQERAVPAGRPSPLHGRRVAYVGGRPNVAPHLKALVESLDGRFVHHDGGIEGNRAELEEVVAGAELVFCPVDCVSHDACSRAKLCCRRTGSTFVTLRSANISSFSAALEQTVSRLQKMQG